MNKREAEAIKKRLRKIKAEERPVIVKDINGMEYIGFLTSFAPLTYLRSVRDLVSIDIDKVFDRDGKTHLYVCTDAKIDDIRLSTEAEEKAYMELVDNEAEPINFFKFMSNKVYDVSGIFKSKTE